MTSKQETKPCALERQETHGELGAQPETQNVQEKAPQMSAKKMKKMMKRAQNDPKLKALMNMMAGHSGAGNANGTSDMSAKDKLVMKLRQAKVSRGGPLMQESIRKKDAAKREKQQLEMNVPPTQDEHAFQDYMSKIQASQQVLAERRAHNKRIAKLSKKYGDVSFERYTQALAKLDTLVETDETAQLRRQEQNLIDVYLRQHPVNSELTETRLDLDDSGSGSDSEGETPKLEALADPEGDMPKLELELDQEAFSDSEVDMPNLETLTDVVEFSSSS
jgi:hypothetical protein